MTNASNLSTPSPSPRNVTLRCEAFAYPKVCDELDGGNRFMTFHLVMTVINVVCIVDFFVLSHMLGLWKNVLFKKKLNWTNFKAPQRIMVFIAITLLCNFFRFLLPVSLGYPSSFAPLLSRPVLSPLFFCVVGNLTLDLLSYSSSSRRDCTCRIFSCGLSTGASWRRTRRTVLPG